MPKIQAQSLRVNNLLEDSLIIVTADHGHSLWDRRGFIGKRHYPSDPETFELPLLVRHPGGLGAGTRCDALVQAHDLAPTMLEAAGLESPGPMDGQSFYRTAFAGDESARKHVTVGWGGSFTVIDDQWWFNCKVDGTGALLYPVSRKLDQPSVAHEHPDLVRTLFRTGRADAGGSFPDYLLEQAAALPDLPGSAPFNAAS